MYDSSRAPSERACLGLSLRAFNIALDLCLRITLELDADVIESDDLLRAFWYNNTVLRSYLLRPYFSYLAPGMIVVRARWVPSLN
jgi:hypothetical protein